MIAKEMKTLAICKDSTRTGRRLGGVDAIGYARTPSGSRLMKSGLT